MDKEKKSSRKLTAEDYDQDREDFFSAEMIEMSPSLMEIMKEVSEKLHSYKHLTPTSHRSTHSKTPESHVRFSPTEDSSTDRPHTSRSLTPTKYRSKSILKNESAPSVKDKSSTSRKTHSSPESETSGTYEEEEQTSKESSTELTSKETVSSKIRDKSIVFEDRRPPAEGEACKEEFMEELVDSDDKLPSKTIKNKKERKRRKCAFWYTSEMFRETDREQFIFLSIQEFIIYLIFLASVSIVVFGSFTAIMYYYSIVLSDVFTRTKFKTAQGLAIAYTEVRTIQQYWAYLRNAFINTLFFKYLEDQLAGNTLTMEESKLVLLQNILVGVPRLRQLRVRPDSCKVPQDFAGAFRSCYGYYRPYNEDRTSFGLKTGSEWTYSEKLADAYEGKISTYGTGGYYLNLTRSYVFSKRIIDNLHDNLWIDHGTRAVFIDFTLYTPNVNLFCMVKLVAEFPPSGGVIPSSRFHTLKLIRYVSFWDHIILGLEVVTVVMLFLYTAEEIREIFVLKWNYIFNAWNILDLTIVILGWNLVTIGCLRYLWISNEIPYLINMINKDDHANFDSLSEIQLWFNTASAFFVALVWVKFIKYMMLIKVMYHLLKTIGKCAHELLGLTLILILLLIAFALLGHLLFGAQVEEFGTMKEAMISLLVLLVGALDYKKVHEARPFLGPLYFMLYIYLFILVFLSLFVAVLVNGFTTVRFDIMEDRSKIYLKNIFYDCLNNLLKFISFNKLSKRLKEKQRRDIAEENYNVIIDILRRSGFRGRELDLFLKKHKIQKGRDISTQKMAQIYDDIDGKGQIYIEAIEHEQIMNDIDLLRLRMAYSDKMTEELASKIECLFAKISPTPN
ncbi:unnamed protein product [Nezara viridula]|uniref:Polycystic kidney disease 2-like 1 protein n=1 Tax=Nezara viridula TaxID=85310 RepID=A0A9P0HUB4_NEZVI|nr:unnamed protein product [Nezara viridula]